MGDRPDDLVPLLTGSPGDSGPVRWGQGVVVSWNPLTAENVIHWRGTDLANLPIVASSSEVLAMKPGDSVGLNIIGSGASATVYVVGRITLPGTTQAASFLSVFGVKSATVATAETRDVATWGDLATAGPTVTDVLIGSTGRCLVLITSTIVQLVTDGHGAMAYEISGATTVPTGDTPPDLSCDGPVGHGQTASRLVLQTGLNPGLHTFTAKYSASDFGVGGMARFAGRNLTVMPL